MCRPRPTGRRGAGAADWPVSEPDFGPRLFTSLRGRVTGRGWAACRRFPASHSGSIDSFRTQICSSSFDIFSPSTQPWSARALLVAHLPSLVPSALTHSPSGTFSACGLSLSYSCGYFGLALPQWGDVTDDRCAGLTTAASVSLRGPVGHVPVRRGPRGPFTHAALRAHAPVSSAPEAAEQTRSSASADLCTNEPGHPGAQKPRVAELAGPTSGWDSGYSVCSPWHGLARVGAGRGRRWSPRRAPLSPCPLSTGVTAAKAAAAAPPLQAVTARLLRGRPTVALVAYAAGVTSPGKPSRWSAGL